MSYWLIPVVQTYCFVCVTIYYSTFYFFLMLVAWFLSELNIFDCQVDGFYLLSLLKCEFLYCGFF